MWFPEWIIYNKHAIFCVIRVIKYLEKLKKKKKLKPSSQAKQSSLGLLSTRKDVWFAPEFTSDAGKTLQLPWWQALEGITVAGYAPHSTALSLMV